MTRTPTLGETPEEAFRSAYSLGYDHFDGLGPSDFIDREELDLDADSDQPFHEALAESELSIHEFEAVRVAISESAANRALWRALDDFYQEHLPEQYDQFKREAAVAEDYDTAFSAGAYAAIRGDDADPERDIGLFLPDDDETEE